MRTVLGFDTVITGYGLTEACGIATMCRHDDDNETIATTSGRAIPGVNVMVVDAGGEEVPRGEPGEVIISGYNTMLGYLDEPEETAKALDKQGWLKTGDIGVMNERGYLRITDRQKDMFIVGGFNAYPAEIENIVMKREDVAHVAVIGVPNQRMGEVGKAYVVAKPNQTIDETEFLGWCRDNMANFKAPRSVEFVADLPRNATGKVQKFKLRQR
jgi:acyl-CoA synthetase (AMP-forming)/AMP-acid ligase II